MWSQKDEHVSHNKIHKCMTIMRQIGRGRTNISQVAKLHNMAYRIAKDYQVICDRL
jgi:uncharacterized membrane protein YjjP (DUF1212 family)